jgi:hypothetical protein
MDFGDVMDGTYLFINYLELKKQLNNIYDKNPKNFDDFDFIAFD